MRVASPTMKPKNLFSYFVSQIPTIFGSVYLEVLVFKGEIHAQGGTMMVSIAL